MQISRNIILCRLDNVLGMRWKGTSSSGMGGNRFLTDFMVEKQNKGPYRAQIALVSSQ